jgi:integrase/recombinase XerD
VTGAQDLVDPIAAAYLAWCERERHPENTIRRRRTVLRAVGNPGTATREQIEAWWDNRLVLPNGLPRADTTRANELAILRSFYTWCQIWEHRSDNPTVRLQSPRVGQGVPRPATRKEFDDVLAFLELLPTDGPALRRAVLLGTWAGLRISEAAALSWPDIDLDTRQARVVGKGRKTRLVTFSAKLLDELGPAHAGNVVTGRAKGWATTTLGRKVNAAIHAAGPDITFHKLRHRYGSTAYQRTKDPKALANQMGHASVATTMSFYAAAADDAARAIADAVSD